MKGAKVVDLDSSPSLPSRPAIAPIATETAIVPFGQGLEDLDELVHAMRLIKPSNGARPLEKKAPVYLSSKCSWIVSSSVTICSPVVGSSFIL